MRKLLVLWLFFGITFMAEAQEERFPTRAVYAELGGMGLVYSVNYDMRFHKDKMDGWGVRAGLGGYVYREYQSMGQTFRRGTKLAAGSCG